MLSWERMDAFRLDEYSEATERFITKHHGCAPGHAGLGYGLVHVPRGQAPCKDWGEGSFQASTSLQTAGTFTVSCSTCLPLKITFTFRKAWCSLV